jgi:hypothetical protein
LRGMGRLCVTSEWERKVFRDPKYRSRLRADS